MFLTPYTLFCSRWVDFVYIHTDYVGFALNYDQTE